MAIEYLINSVNRYLALGDSYTIGEGVAECDRWPEQWARRMNIDPPVRIIAKTGWTTDELQHAIDESGDLGIYRHVSLLIGVNNQYRGRSVDQYHTEFAKLAGQAIHFADNNRQHVFVLSIPDWGQTPFGLSSGRDLKQISAEIDAFNQAAKYVCNGLGIAYVDITALTRENSKNTLMHADDGLHPSKLMYEMWVNTLLSPN